MTGDFSRMTFDKNKHFLRVLMQQGRVQLDSDWNEQVAILLHYLQTVVKDIIGPYAGPEEAWGFEIKGGGTRNFTIGAGRYYVNGILVQNENEVWYQPQDGEAPRLPQPDLPCSPQLALKKNGNYLVYLDVWERPITYIQDDDIREKALGGPDTATRSKVVWQVKVEEFNPGENPCQEGKSLLEGEKFKPSRVRLIAKARRDQAPTEPCLIDPESRYRGAENQLYRVEIHRRGTIGGDDNSPTFKWSRDNGSVVFPIKKIIVDNGSSKTAAELEHLGRDSSSSLAEGDWVELVDDDYTLIDKDKAGSLLKVLSIDRENMNVTLKGSSDLKVVSEKHPFLRRWDHKQTTKISLEEDGTILISKLSNGGESDDGEWLELEDGIEIQFDIQNGSSVRSGDYWLIPARTATGDVEWPRKDDCSPRPMPPHGVVHHYAPLATISVNDDDGPSATDCRCSFGRISECPWDLDQDAEN